LSNISLQSNKNYEAVFRETSIVSRESLLIVSWCGTHTAPPRHETKAEAEA
jgi:hypothetical protein